MLSLLIVDDEEEILEGLSEIVDWHSLGFQVVGKLTDGREAIAFIQENKPDAVLSDIKMTFCSGLDVAKYVFEHHPDMKVVLLSGYQEFILAREAIRYQVAHYLLKPTNLHELHAVFKELRQQIESEKRNREREVHLEHQYRTILPLLQEQFFIQLLAGIPHNKDEIQEKLKLFGILGDYEHLRCGMIYVKWYEQSGKEWSSDKQNECMKALRAVFNKEKEEIMYAVIHTRDRHFYLVAIALADIYAAQFEKRIEQHFIQSQNSLNNVLQITIQLKSMNLFDNLDQLVMKQAADEEDFVSTKLLQARNSSDIRTLKNSIVDVLGMMKGSSDHADTMEVMRELEPYNDMESLREWCQSNLESMIPILDEKSERSSITKSKEIIAARFNEDLSLEDIAEEVGLNPVYFSRLFKQETGMNFSDYRIEVRMNKAIEYLKDPQYKVYEICYLVGYKNLKYFYKLFKKHTRLTPSDYRDGNGGRYS